jgi:small-conductance mechanosensitive channel
MEAAMRALLSGMRSGLVVLATLLVAGPLSAQAPPVGVQAEAPAESEVKLTDLAKIEQLVGKDFAKAAEIVRDIWDFEIVHKPSVVTVGTLALGIVLLGLSYISSSMTSRWVARKLLARFGVGKNAVAPLQSLTFYSLLAMFTMLSLTILHVPITAFSFLGGAVAIGAGFGSQNIINNFISGLILLVERPIRVGDVVEFDGMTGTVSQIGARSTKIATGVNHDIIVPNSKLLETSVVNWTLSDDIVGANVTVGVAYGSPTREVERLLLQAANQHDYVLKEPASDVILADFAADALQFKLRVWINLRAARRVQVESDLRFAIDELFAARGIVMSYPQRDVHLNVLRPVEVRMAQPPALAKVA